MQKMMLHTCDKVGHCNDFSHTPVDLCRGTVRSGLEQVMEKGVAGPGSTGRLFVPLLSMPLKRAHLLDLGCLWKGSAVWPANPFTSGVSSSLPFVCDYWPSCKSENHGIIEWPGLKRTTLII